MEVMVVVLIIGILLGIGIPTFVGARSRGQDAAAQASLSTAATAASLLSDFGADFTRASPAALAAAEPSLSYLTSSAASSGPNEVSVSETVAGEWTATVQSDAGTCFGIELTAQSRTLFETGSCSAGLAGPPVPPVPTNLSLDSIATISGGQNARNTADGDLSTFGQTDWLGANWFAYDLGSISTIEQIVLWNRTDCCSNRTRDLTIYISNSPIPTNKTAAAASGVPSFSHPGTVGSPSTMTINTVGRYVVIFGSGPNTAFREVEIVGIPT